MRHAQASAPCGSNSAYEERPGREQAQDRFELRPVAFAPLEHLPDEALRGLQLIIRNMLTGKVPLQALLTLISFLE